MVRWRSELRCSPQTAPCLVGPPLIPYGETRFINDVLGTLGVSEVANGQVRVTKMSGDGVMWAMMPITRADGSLSQPWRGAVVNNLQKRRPNPRAQRTRVTRFGG